MTWLKLIVLLVLTTAACTSSDAADDDNTENTPLASAVEAFETQFTVTSPNEELRIETGLDDLGRARYRVVRVLDDQDVVVLGDSTFGVETSIGSFARPGSLTAVGPSELIVDVLDLPFGKALGARIEARTQSLLAGDLTIDLWVADTGVAFRYRIDRPGETFTVEWERTSFAVPPENRTWLQQHDPPSRFAPAYERLRSREATATNPGRSAVGWTFPALFADEHTWSLITEAALADGAAGSHLSPTVTNGEYLLDFAAFGEGNGTGDPQPVATDSWTSPWRVIINSSDLGDIVESDIVLHLSPAVEDPEAYDWVTPGRVSWSWWSDSASSQDADAIEPFIDLATEMQWEYSLVDANWNMFGYERLAELVQYADQRNVGLFVWYNSGGLNNAVAEAPRNLMADRTIRRAEFERLATMGVVGVKIDFFHSDKPATIQLYRDILVDAADFELMVNFHGSTVPRGWSREFPNLLTMEAVRGAEIYKFFPSYQRAAPRQNTVLPFTRNVVGAMDYTPVILGDEQPRRTTNSHELALAVVFESPLLHLVDTPEAYLSQPAEIQDLLTTVPVIWDETQFVAGTPESHAVIARRLGDVWWIGAISALDETETVVVDLDSLGVPPDAPRLQVCDNPSWDRDDAGTYLDPTQYLISTGEAGGSIALQLLPQGGCLVRLG